MARPFPHRLRCEAPRPSFPEHERRLPWLGPLLDACCIADSGVAEGIRRETDRGRRLACRKGCAHCCRSHETVPVYPLELMGIAWYVTEIIEGPLRGRLHDRLAHHRDLPGCPFLVDDSCSIYPLRPMACRLLNVFDRACAPGEDVFYSRHGDLLTPLPDYREATEYEMLPFYGFCEADERREALRSGRLHQLARVLRDLDWASLAKRMAARDAGQPAALDEALP
ncbi:YkgJ family cysteine cluster protein [Thiohalobacter sp.]|uniref:YkgJ family cysteine cluster protein n=1 Tax=Thiohalobacter sp. TaxID=2025948 RepID=UPI0026312101|nr:YkgJ family cysteine cluster protein [Thiohalobacter sp.]